MKKILVFCSDFEQLRALVRFLGQGGGGNEVHGCEDLDAARFIIKGFKPDVIVTDWQLGADTADQVLLQLVAQFDVAQEKLPVATIMCDLTKVTGAEVANALRRCMLKIVVQVVEKNEQIGEVILQQVAQA